MARPDHRSHRAQARKSSLKEDKCSNASATSSSGVFESIISTMCCRSSSTASYSRSKDIVEEDDGDNVVKSDENYYYFWDDMRSFFRYSIRPVAFITIQESSSVDDGSELTLPHVLVRMAEKHDEQNNADEVLSMIQGDNNSIDCQTVQVSVPSPDFSEVLFPKPVYPGDTLRSKTNRARSERGCKCRPTKGDSNII